MRPMRLRGAGLLVASALVLTGCGDDGGDTASADVTVVTTEYAFSPDTWSVSAGEAFTVEMTNEGAIEHEWAVIDLGEDIESEDEFEEDIVLLEVEAIPAGQTTTQSFTIAEAGTYQVICALPGHFAEGMEGTLTVE